MDKLIVLLFTLVGGIFCLNANANTISSNTAGSFVESANLAFNPELPTPFDSVTATISGSFTSASYSINENMTTVTINSNNSIDIDLYIAQGLGIQISSPYTTDAIIGLLATGLYEVTANYFLLDPSPFSTATTQGYGGMPDFSFSSQLQVVPIPAAVWLLFTGLVSLLAFNRKR